MAKFGAIFDFDGVIIDSAQFHERSWELLAAEEGRELPADHFERGFGRKNHYIIPKILRWTKDKEEVQRLSQRKEALYRELLAEGDIEPLPGVREWLEVLKAAEVPCIIGSSTERKNLDTILAHTGLRDYFVDLVSCEDVGAGKPDPEVFLKCAEKIDVAAGDCVVFEDMPVGIEAGKAAGMLVVAVATSHDAEELRELADVVVAHLDSLNVEILSALRQSQD